MQSDDLWVHRRKYVQFTPAHRVDHSLPHRLAPMEKTDGFPTPHPGHGKPLDNPMDWSVPVRPEELLFLIDIYC